MGTLEGISADDLRERLATAEGAKEAKRLMVALSYLDGEPVAELSDRYGIPAPTLYYWFDRFESRPLEEAVVDDHRPGRPSELSADERAELAETLEATPGEYGYDATSWSPPLVQRHVAETYGVEYSLGHVRRLLRERDERLATTNQ